MPPILIDSGRTEVRTSWLGKHPIDGSVAIAALTGVAVQLTHMIFQDRVAALVGWNVSVRFVDFGFRMVLGAVVVLGLLPWLFGYVLRRRNEHILVNSADRDLVLGSPRTLVDSVVDLLEIRPEVSLTSDDALRTAGSRAAVCAPDRLAVVCDLGGVLDSEFPPAQAIPWWTSGRRAPAADPFA